MGSRECVTLRTPRPASPAHWAWATHRSVRRMISYSERRPGQLAGLNLKTLRTAARFPLGRATRLSSAYTAPPLNLILQPSLSLSAPAAPTTPTPRHPWLAGTATAASRPSSRGTRTAALAGPRCCLAAAAVSSTLSFSRWSPPSSRPPFGAVGPTILLRTTRRMTGFLTEKRTKASSPERKKGQGGVFDKGVGATVCPFQKLFSRVCVKEFFCCCCCSCVGW